MKERKISAAVTAAAAVVITAVLLLGHLSFNPAAMPPSRQPAASVAEADDEFVDLLESLNSPSPSDPSRARAERPADNADRPAPEGGQDLENAGAAALPQPETVQQNPAPVSRRERTPAPTGPTREEREREEARRRAERDMANAFSTPADGNTSAPGRTPGPNGNPEGTDTPVSGSGQGTVGGGWVMPDYASIPSALTGSIRLRATVDATGAVTRVEQIGGETPASTDTRLVESCMAEVRQRRFTRPDNAPPATATAYITYIFK